MIKKLSLSILTLCIVASCAMLPPAAGPSPEAQIVNGANTVAAAATIGTVLLKNGKITATQAKGYRALLETASVHLDNTAHALSDCRKKTASTNRTVPDPCAPNVAGDIALVLSIATDVHRTLSSK